MNERSFFEQRDNSQFEKYHKLLQKSHEGIEKLSNKEREKLTEFGYYYLDKENNPYEATHAFRAVQDFAGLRKTVDKMLLDKFDSIDIPWLLNRLEDHEGIRDFLNNNERKLSKYSYDAAFKSLEKQLFTYIDKFLEKNNTPVATGVLNVGVDLVAIHNLAQQYDIAVPIARGGLRQGAIAQLWGMPTKLVDIAAHGRKTARGKWINDVVPEDFAGKKVLLFDKDAISGATVNKIVKMLAKYKPAEIAVYFAHDVVPRNVDGIGTRTEGLPPEMKVYHPGDVPMQDAGDIYIEAHERLETQYGRLRKINRKFIEESHKTREASSAISKALNDFIAKNIHTFEMLNPKLPGVSSVRESILAMLNKIYDEYREYCKIGIFDIQGTEENFVEMLGSMTSPYAGFEKQLIDARFRERSYEAAKKRGVENPHLPNNPLASFEAAERAVKKGFDVALIVGPEGFAYEPYFQDLGLPTVAVNIPESGAGENRSIKLFDGLSELSNKKVLVVEDDVRTGATLQKLLEHLRPHGPKGIGLYLGQPERYQMTARIPSDFTDVFVAQDSNPRLVGINFQKHLESKGLKIFKNIDTNK